jgi:hypothetical protein
MNINKVFNREQETLSNRDVAVIMLVKEAGEILSNRDSCPEDIFNIAYDYLFLGCKCREDYIRLVNYCIEDEGIRRDLV